MPGGENERMANTPACLLEWQVLSTALSRGCTEQAKAQEVAVVTLCVAQLNT